MIIGYSAWPPDNDTYMWAHTKKTGPAPSSVVCSACEVRKDWEAINPKYKPPRSYYDLSRTYDGDILVSPRLREHLEKQKLPDLRFVELSSSRRYFVLQCASTLRLVQSPKVRMEEYCGQCKQYRSVWGTDPERLQGVTTPIKKGMYFSDLKVGYYPQMGPLLIVGVDTWQTMVAQKFKGLGNAEAITH